MSRPANPEALSSVPWYRVPFAWLAIAVLVASLAGCAWIIVVSLQYRDEPVAAPQASVLGVPVQPISAPP
ncbi:MAG TPA: hypothetical protein VF265_05435 [Nevskiaceae bacterium]